MDAPVIIRHPPTIKSDWIRKGLGSLVDTRVENGRFIAKYTNKSAGGREVEVMLLPYDKTARMSRETDVLITCDTIAGRKLHSIAKTLGFRRIIHYFPGGAVSTTRRVVDSRGGPRVLSADMVATSRDILKEFIKMLLYPMKADVNDIDLSRCLPGCSGTHVGGSCADQDGDVIM